MIAPTRYDTTLFAGESEVIDVTVEDEGEVPDLAGATAAYKLSRGHGGEALVEIEAVIDADVVTVVLEAEDTEGLETGRYWHQIHLSEIDGRETVIMTGRVVIRAPAVTPAP